jgi:hypothetical protein
MLLTSMTGGLEERAAAKSDFRSKRTSEVTLILSLAKVPHPVQVLLGPELREG